MALLDLVASVSTRAIYFPKGHLCWVSCVLSPVSLIEMSTYRTTAVEVSGAQFIDTVHNFPMYLEFPSDP